MEYTPIADVADLADLAQQVNFRLGEMAEHFEADHVGIVVPRENTESGEPLHLTVQDVLLPLMGQASPTSSAKLIDAEAVLGGTQWEDLTDGGETLLHHHDARYVNVSGDTMTGTLNMGDNSISYVKIIHFESAGPDPTIQESGGYLVMQAGASYAKVAPASIDLLNASIITMTAPQMNYNANDSSLCHAFRTGNVNIANKMAFYRNSNADGLTLWAIAAGNEMFTGTAQGDVGLAVGSAATMHLGAGVGAVVAELKIADGAVTVTGTLAVTGGLTSTGNITMAEDTWIGITGPAERLLFNGSADQIEVQGANLLFAGTNKAIFEVAGQEIYAGATGYIDYKTPTAHRFDTLVDLVATTATAGQITQAGNALLHTYGTSNLFLGINVGNFTLTGTNNMGFGGSVMANLTSGHHITAAGFASGLNLTEGFSDSLFGESSGRALTTGDHVTAIGTNALSDLVSGNSDTAVGSRSLANVLGSEATGLGAYSGFTNTSGGGLYLGYAAGFYETGADKFFIDNALRDDEADGRVKALVYGEFHANTVSQLVRFNSKVEIREDSLMIGTAKWQFNAATEFIHSGAAGYVDYGAATEHRFAVGANMVSIQVVGSYAHIGTTNAFFSVGAQGNVCMYFGTTETQVALPMVYYDNVTARFGTGGDAHIFYNGTNLIIDPDVVGSGKVYIGATADDDLWFGNARVSGTGKIEWRDAELHISSPADSIMAIVADGCITLGAIATNYTAFEADGTRVAYGAATTFNDIYLPFEGAHVPAANNPTWTAWLGNVEAYTFAVNDFLGLQATELVHTYLEDSNFELHVHWCTNGLEAAAKYVKWEIEYSIANSAISGAVGDTFPATTVVSAETEIPASTPDRKNMYTAVATITGTNFKMGAILKVRVRRIASAGAAPAADPFGFMVGIHVEQDTDGSRAQRTK